MYGGCRSLSRNLEPAGSLDPSFPTSSFPGSGVTRTHHHTQLFTWVLDIGTPACTAKALATKPSSEPLVLVIRMGFHVAQAGCGFHFYHWDCTCVPCTWLDVSFLKGTAVPFSTAAVLFYSIHSTQGPSVSSLFVSHQSP